MAQSRLETHTYDKAQSDRIIPLIILKSLNHNMIRIHGCAGFPII
jgi:hypothetical protein